MNTQYFLGMIHVSPVFLIGCIGILVLGCSGGILNALSISLEFHRSGTHGGVKFHPVVRLFFETVILLINGVPKVEWDYTHRVHHRTSDTKRDPHSPKFPFIIKIFGRKIRIKGPPGTFLRYFLLYKKLNEKEKEKLGNFIEREGYFKGKSEFYVLVYNDYCWMGPILLFTVYLILFGIPGIWIFLIQFFWVPFFSGFVVNGLGHGKEVLNERTKDFSSNTFGYDFMERLPIFWYVILWIPWTLLKIAMSLFTGGEWLHGEHHNSPKSARLTHLKSEIDFGWIVIWCLWKVGLATEVTYYTGDNLTVVHLPDKGKKAA